MSVVDVIVILVTVAVTPALNLDTMNYIRSIQKVYDNVNVSILDLSYILRNVGNLPVWHQLKHAKTHHLLRCLRLPAEHKYPNQQCRE